MHILCGLALRQESQPAHPVLLEGLRQRAEKFTQKMAENPSKNRSEIKVFGLKMHFGTSQEAQMLHARPSEASGRPIEAQNGPFEAILGLRKSPIFCHPVEKLQNLSRD